MTLDFGASASAFGAGSFFAAMRELPPPSTFPPFTQPAGSGSFVVDDVASTDALPAHLWPTGAAAAAAGAAAPPTPPIVSRRLAEFSEATEPTDDSLPVELRGPQDLVAGATRPVVVPVGRFPGKLLIAAATAR